MKQTPVDLETVNRLKQESGIANIGKASIRELVKLVGEIEECTGTNFVKMEMGVPGLPAPQIAIEAEMAALRKGVASIYPSIEGVPELKHEASCFIKNFINVDVSEECCIPTVGSMQASISSFLVASHLDNKRNRILFIDPGFPVQKTQLKVLGIPCETFDICNYRGEKLRSKLERYLSEGNIAAIVYSNPNNPSWVCLTDNELKIIGSLATAYEAVVIEDLAYFGMDFRNNISKPGVPPYQPSVANYTSNYILLISGSKSFSYAGQRIACMAISNDLFVRNYPSLKENFSHEQFGKAMIYGPIYTFSSGVTHSVQYGFAAVLKAANEGRYNFQEETREYGQRAKLIKDVFLRNGFYLVYDNDEGKPLADGFYFTVGYPGLSGDKLVEELLYYGVSAISLSTTGSKKEGIRACVSQVSRAQINDLAVRLMVFKKNHEPVPSAIERC